MDFSVYEHNTSSEESGESSKARNLGALGTMKTLRINDRATVELGLRSPTPLRRTHQTQIYKSKSGHSIKDFARQQEL